MKTFSLSLLTKIASGFIVGTPLLFCGLPQGWSDDESQGGVRASGVIFNIASDRKVEKIGGIMQPEPLDFYLKRLFEELSKKMDQMDLRLQSIEAAVHLNVAQPSAVPLDTTEKNKK